MTQVSTRSWGDSPEDAPPGKKAVPEGLWIRCPACSGILFRRSVENNLWVCPECQHHFRVSGEQRVKQLADPGSFEPMNADMAPMDPLNFIDLQPYKERIAAAQKKTGQNDGVQTGRAFIKGRRVILACMDFTFLGGSMGSVIGEKITLAIEAAGENNLPLVIVSASGGARMMESGFSLMQMAKTTAALARFDDQGGLFISVLTDPTTGGVTASFAMLGDVILAEPKALIGFAGPRVIQQTIRQELPEGFQRAEFLQDCGFIDRVIARSELRSEISSIIDYAGK
ncbi:MAG: acetyl-CoA carboxylase, carboxyltransferase subunit beta [Phycisphaerales bacterium]|nr:acetyl-CoA carboxylase, carboxyltransferase subunit beta [Phycisphaerales bacterium]MCI0631052.1 acetyl-CoA carboxylase, carboxyltransferase subunit beta [Phycisphaerales bacterium]MCI0674293.1 acetyl-CoA carboxylase, carboxyltransferase subunit beta [Phycisphaerales bacterium]